MARRWVRFEAPVMVCVEVDDATGHAQISKVVLGIEPQDIHPAHDQRGGVVVYDEDMRRVTEPNAGGGHAEAGDAVTVAAVDAAQDRAGWPDPDSLAWEEGPDALRYPELYDEDPVPDAGITVVVEEYEPLDLFEDARRR